MSLSFQDLQEALTLDDKDEFVIWQNSSKRNKRVKRGNLFASKGVTVRGKFIDSESGNDVGFAAATAEANSLLAIADAEGAQATADGKNTVFYSNDQPSTSGRVVGDIWFEIDQGYKTYKWGGSSWQAYESNGDTVLSGLNVGKLTSGFISSQVIELSDSTAYLQSSKFIESWTSTRSFTGYVRPKVSATHVDQCKVLQTNGTYRVYNAKRNNTNVTPPTGTFPAQDDDWLEIAVPTISITIEQGGTPKNIPDLGFRIVGQGQAEFHGVLARGAIVANEGFFGTTINAVRLNDKGLTVGNNGYVKSAGIGYSGTSFTSTSGSGGFFLGNTQAEGATELYQFFIGDPSGNSLRWNGTDLRINGKLLAGTEVGLSGDSSFGLTINSQFGIRRAVANGTLTITGGDGNGVQYGAQIDLVGSFLNTSGDDTGNGQLSLQAGYNGSNNFNGPVDGSIVFRTSKFTTASTADVGIMRMLIALDGTVLIGKGDETAGNSGSAPNSGSGKLIVSTSITSGGADLFGNNTNGLIYVKNNSDSATITLTGTSGDVSATQFTTSSSKRVKTNIKKLKNGLDTVQKLNPVSFKRKGTGGKNDIGLIAEEVDKILPEVTGKDQNGQISGLDYSKLTAVLIQAVKELSVEVDRLKSKIK